MKGMKVRFKLGTVPISAKPPSAPLNPALTGTSPAIATAICKLRSLRSYAAVGLVAMIGRSQVIVEGNCARHDVPNTDAKPQHIRNDASLMAQGATSHCTNDCWQGTQERVTATWNP